MTGAQTPCAPHPARPVRRVGTTTMGLVLIVAGVAITAGLLNPRLDFTLLCKLSPLVLVALGVEVLIAARPARQAKLKYDFLSMLVCAFHIFVSLCGAAAAPLLEYRGPGYWRVADQLENRWYDQVYQALSDVEGVQDFSCGLYPADWAGASELREEGFDAVESGWIQVTLKGNLADEKVFADACRPVVEALRHTSVETPSLEIFWEGADRSYTLRLDGPFAWQQEDLSDFINTAEGESAL